MASSLAEPAHRADLNEWRHRTYWLGGSPCAGKSSVADLLAERYGLTVYRCDDAYFRHIQICNPQDQPTLHAITSMSWDEIWMRSVDVQVMADGALLVSDDYAHAIYRIAPKGR